MKMYDFAMSRLAGGKISDVWSRVDIQATHSRSEATGDRLRGRRRQAPLP